MNGPDVSPVCHSRPHLDSLRSLIRVADTIEETKAVCNRTIVLTTEVHRVTVTSPGFPRPYPDNLECHTEVLAPHGYRLIVDFDELILEEEQLE